MQRIKDALGDWGIPSSTIGRHPEADRQWRFAKLSPIYAYCKNIGFVLHERGNIKWFQIFAADPCISSRCRRGAARTTIYGVGNVRAALRWMQSKLRNCSGLPGEMMPLSGK
jgi:hypothetical protein